MNNRLTLLGLDIGGEWNVPLLRNAAEMSGASLVFAHANDPSTDPVGASTTVGESFCAQSLAQTVGAEESVSGEAEDLLQAAGVPDINGLLEQFDCVIACEAIRQSRTIYDYACPRGHIGVIVGNELKGIPRRVLKKVDQVVSVPMLGRGMSSVNVAVAAAIVLYGLERDLARKRVRPSSSCHRNVDLLIMGPENPSELGSLLRSAWAFGWKRIFLDDPNRVWFSKDRSTVLAGRAAARREVNPVAILPCDQIEFSRYDAIVSCDGELHGTPLSRLSLPTGNRLLLVYGQGELPRHLPLVERVYVDYRCAEVKAAFRHAGSVFLSIVANRLARR